MNDELFEIKLDLDVTQAKKDVKELYKEVEQIFNSRRGTESPKLNSVDAQIKTITNRLKILEKELDTIGKKQYPTDEYKSLEKQLSSVTTQYNKLISKQKEINKVAEDYEVIQKEIAGAQDKLSMFEGRRDISYDRVLEELNTYGTITADTWKTYQQSIDAVNAQAGKVSALIDAANSVKFTKAAEWTEDVVRASMAVDGLNSKIRDLEESGKGFYLGTETVAYEKKLNAVSSEVDRLNINLAKREAILRTDASAMKVHTEAVVEEESEYENWNGLVTDAVHDLMHEFEDEAYTRERTIDREIEAERKAAEESQRRAEARTNNYNATREALMGITSVTRGLTGLLPDLRTTTLINIIAITRGVTRLTSMTKNQLTYAIGNVQTAIEKIVALISAHPVITAMIVAISLLIAAIIKITNFLSEIDEEIREFEKTALDVAKTIGGVVVDSFGEFVKILGESFGKLTTMSVRLLISTLQNFEDTLNSVISTVKDTIEVMAALNDGINEVNDSLSTLTSSLNYLHDAFSAAFAPILNYVKPVLSQFIDMTADAMNAVGMLVAKLLGASSYTMVIRKQKEYNKELEKMGKAASESLAPFDKLNIISTSKGSSNNNVDDPNSLFDSINIELMSIDDIIAQLGVEGRKLGTSLADYLNSLDWDSITTKAGKAGEAVSTFINSFFSHPDLGSELGELFGGAINSVSQFIAKLFGDDDEGLDIDELSSQFAGFITSAIESYDPEISATAISNLVNAIIGFIAGTVSKLSVDDITELATKLGTTIRLAINNINWDLIKSAIVDIGGKLATFFNGIMTPENITAVANAIANAINTAMYGISAFAGKIDWRNLGVAISSSLNNFVANWDIHATTEAINNIVSGIFNMLHTAIVGEEYEAILTPDLRKQKFKRGGIDWQALGEKLMEGIRNIDWKGFAKYAVEISTEILEGLQTVFDEIRKDPEAFADLINVLAQIWLESKKWETFVENTGTALENAFMSDEGIKKYKFKEVGHEIVDTLATSVNNTTIVGKTFSTFVALICDAMVDDLSDAVYDTGEDIGESNVAGVLKGMGNIASSIFSSDVSKTSSTVSKTVDDSLRDAFDIHSPSRLMAEDVGLPILQGIMQGIKGYVGSTKQLDIESELSDWWTVVISPFADKVSGLWNTISTDTAPYLSAYKKLVKNTNTTLKTTLETNNSKIKSNFINTWEKISAGIKSPLNSIITVFESFTNTIISGMNSLITNLNTFKLELPEALTGTSDKTYSFNISKLNSVSIPKLAQGTVVPPNMSQFLAVLGDNNKETEVVSPLSTIEQALRNVLTEQNVNVTFQVEGDPHGMFKVVQKEATNYTRRTGRLAF